MQRIFKLQFRTFAAATKKTTPRISKTKLSPIDDNKALSPTPSQIVQPKTKTKASSKTIITSMSTSTPAISSTKTVITSTKTTPSISSILTSSTSTPSSIPPYIPDPVWLQSCKEDDKGAG